MGSVSSVGGSSNVPQQPQQEPTSNQNELQAMDAFSTMVQQLASLLAEAKEGGKNHG
ncbi:MAG: hypothetical protein H7A38_01765 [Chlamydiales bacterium]|nr:hypothetical protein [Chlamydiales bacterium]